MFTVSRGRHNSAYMLGPKAPCPPQERDLRYCLFSPGTRFL